MATYAIGDIQGCYDPLLRLLDRLQFDEQADRLWFVGDLVNRGPQSLEVLRFVSRLPTHTIITLGNHDLHLLSRLFVHDGRVNHDDTLDSIVRADDGEELGHWLRHQAILHVDKKRNTLLCHAGICPLWSLAEAISLATELEDVLRSPHFVYFLKYMYGNEPNRWENTLEGFARLRCITNYFTRMRFCDANGGLLLGYKGSLANAPADHFPWYAVPGRVPIETSIIFGHWAALQGQCPQEHIYAIDTGCLWGGQLTALRVEDKQLLQVPGLLSK